MLPEDYWSARYCSACCLSAVARAAVSPVTPARQLDLLL